MSREQAGALRPNKATRQVVVVQGSGGQLEPGQSSGQSCFDRGVLRATTWAAGGHLSGGDWTLAKGESLVSLGGGRGGGGQGPPASGMSREQAGRGSRTQ